MTIIARHLNKSIGEPPTQVLFDINLEIREREFIALTGRSGSGKSTLLYLLSTLDSPSNGLLEIDGENVAQLSQEALYRFRNERMGFVFQFHYLFAELTALENILMPARKAGREAERTPFARTLLDRFGLGTKAHRLPRQLSGGEQQRVAIARALVMQPRYLFADEPTGSLDSVNGEIVMNIIRDSNTEFGTTVVLVTHDADFARSAKRQIHLADGKIVEAATV